MAKIGPEKCNDFGRWYTDYKKNGPECKYNVHFILDVHFLFCTTFIVNAGLY